MNIKDLLQQYEDGTFGYYLKDGDEHCNYKTESKVICMQGEDEDRDEFITKNGITFISNQYGSDLNLDKQVNDESLWVREAVAYQGYGLDKLIIDENIAVRREVADSLNWKDDDFMIDLGNKLLDNGYNLHTNNIINIFTDETCTKFREFHVVYGVNGLIY